LASEAALPEPTPVEPETPLVSEATETKTAPEPTPVEPETPLAVSQAPEPTTETKAEPEAAPSEPTSPPITEAAQSTEPTAPLPEVPDAIEQTPVAEVGSDPSAVTTAEVATPAADVEAPKVNGATASKPEDKSTTPEPAPSMPSAPSTPTKKDSQAFPSTGRSTPDLSPSSSKFGSTSSTRTKRRSIFGRMSLKSIFGRDKEKEKSPLSSP